MALNFPKNPIIGQVYTVDGESWQWDGHCWAPVAGAQTYSPVYIGTFPPTGPLAGDLWWNSNTGRLCIYYKDTDSSQWVSAFQPPDQIVEVSNEQVVDALLASLPEYADAATALANGVAVGGLYRVTGSTTAAGIRAVASYTP